MIPTQGTGNPDPTPTVPTVIIGNNVVPNIALKNGIAYGNLMEFVLYLGDAMGGVEPTNEYDMSEGQMVSKNPERIGVYRGDIKKWTYATYTFTDGIQTRCPVFWF